MSETRAPAADAAGDVTAVERERLRIYRTIRAGFGVLLTPERCTEIIETPIEYASSAMVTLHLELKTKHIANRCGARLGGAPSRERWSTTIMTDEPKRRATRLEIARNKMASQVLSNMLHAGAADPDDAGDRDRIRLRGCLRCPVQASRCGRHRGRGPGIGADDYDADDATQTATS